MVQTLKKALRTSKSAIQDSLDRFLFNYRLTPHSTTGISPAELMYGRRLRSRFDLLWPADSVASRVFDKQQAQKKDHSSGASRSVNLPPDSPVMIRNYTPGGSKWLPSSVVKQTGPLSYKCVGSSGNVVKRHQDQIITRKIPQSPSPKETLPLSVPSFSPVKSPEIAHEPSPVQISMEPSSNTLPEVRRSSRVKRPVVKLDL